MAAPQKWLDMVREAEAFRAKGPREGAPLEEHLDAKDRRDRTREERRRRS